MCQRRDALRNRDLGVEHAKLGESGVRSHIEIPQGSEVHYVKPSWPESEQGDQRTDSVLKGVGS